MRRLIVLVLLSMISSFANANVATLKMQLTGPLKNDDNFMLCLSNLSGCIALNKTTENKSIPISTGTINYLFSADRANEQMFSQKLPESCAIAIKPNQTLIITGNFSTHKNIYHLNSLACRLRS